MTTNAALDITDINLEDIEEQIKANQPPPEVVEVRDQTAGEQEAGEEAQTDEDINHAPLATKEDPTETETQKEEYFTEKKAESSARMLTKMADIFIKYTGHFITGEPVSKYALHKLDREELQETTTEFFKIKQFALSPEYAFFTAIIMIVSSSFMKIYKDYKDKSKEEKKSTEEQERKKAAEIAAVEIEKKDEQQPDFMVEEKVKPERQLPFFEEIPEAVNSRSNFNVYTEEDRPEQGKKWSDDLIGLYKKSPENDRLTYEECLSANDKPSAFVRRLIEILDNKGKSSSDRNRHIRKYLSKLPKKK